MLRHLMFLFFVPKFIVFVAGNSESGTCRTTECQTSVMAPLIDDQDAPLVAKLDMSKANQRINQLITEAIKTKLDNFTETSRDDIIRLLNLEERVKDLVKEIKQNITAFITEDFERIMKEKVDASLDLKRKDELALPMCIALSKKYGHVDAIRRSCWGPHTCATICKALHAGLTCFDAFHIYDKKTGDMHSSAHWYNGGCNRAFCGPNYCCCGRN